MDAAYNAAPKTGSICDSLCPWGGDILLFVTGHGQCLGGTAGIADGDCTNVAQIPAGKQHVNAVIQPGNGAGEGTAQ